jgi:CBS domain containing-hemolysin-like protein
METGVFSLNRLRIRQQMRTGQASAKILFNYYREPERFFWTILVGNTLANAAIITLLVTLLNQYPANGWFWPAFLFGVLVLFIVCDLLPKTLFRTFPNRLCLALATPFRTLQTMLSPLVSIFHGLLWRDAFKGATGQPLANRLFRNRDEFREMMQVEAKGLTDDERMMINRVLDLNERTLGQVVKPLHQMVTVSAETPMSQVIELCQAHRVTRIPVWRFQAGQRRVAGVVTLKTSLYKPDFDPTKPASEYLQSPLYLPEDLHLETALKRMQRSGQWLAIVTRQDRREVGIVALQDILRVLFGEVGN